MYLRYLSINRASLRKSSITSSLPIIRTVDSSVAVTSTGKVLFSANRNADANGLGAFITSTVSRPPLSVTISVFTAPSTRIYRCLHESPCLAIKSPFEKWLIRRLMPEKKSSILSLGITLQSGHCDKSKFSVTLLIKYLIYNESIALLVTCVLF